MLSFGSFRGSQVAAMKRVPIFCSLLPVEFIASKGFEPYYLKAEELSQVERTEYHCAFHENICSYSKALYEYLLKNHAEFSHIIIPTSCDAMKKLYSALLPQVGRKKLFVLDFPKNKDERAVKFYSEELKRLSSWCHCEPFDFAQGRLRPTWRSSKLSAGDPSLRSG